MARIEVGLTGGIASGKSTVGRMLAELGAVVIDADQLARDVVAPGTPGLAAIHARFGDGVIAADGSLDRKALAGLVFADEQARRDLNAIVHPLVREKGRELAQAAPAGAVVVQMIPLLVESGLQDRYPRVVVVDVPEDVQRFRLATRDGMDAAQVDARLAAQATRDERLAAATDVIDNAGDEDSTRRQVQELWRSL